MGRKPRDLTDVPDAELAVLQRLWDEGPATIRQLRDALYPGGGDAEYGTVQKLLERLERKGFVRRQRSEPAHVFAASVAREELIDKRLEDIAEKLCDGSLTPILTHLVRNRRLSARDRKELRDLIDELDKGKGKKSS
jgi:predicted transcriptional regulator